MDTQNPAEIIAQLRAALAESEQDRAALRADNARLKAENFDLEQEARHDPLTGLLNRAGMRHEWDRLISLWKTGLAKITGVILCDSDHFKAVNDMLDHRTGDIVLVMLAETLTKAATGNPVIRTGGDEFVVLVVNVDPLTVAENIRQMADRTMSIRGHDVYVTFSVGVAVNPPIGMRLVDTIDYADHETIRAKRSGRNQVSAIYLDS